MGAPSYVVDHNWCELRDACAFCGEPAETHHPLAVRARDDVMPLAVLCRGCADVDPAAVAAAAGPIAVPCAYCGRPAEGNHATHRDGGVGIGPEVPLCDACGGGESPTLDEIWERISRRRRVPSRVLSRVLLRIQEYADLDDARVDFVHAVDGQERVYAYTWASVIAQAVASGAITARLGARVACLVWGCQEAQDIAEVQVALGMGSPSFDCMMQAARQADPEGYARILPELLRSGC